jgi:PAS domain S-box-containing protein
MELVTMEDGKGIRKAKNEEAGERSGAPGCETQEREAAWRRGELLAKRRQRDVEEERNPVTGFPEEPLINAFVVLAENVRNYAVFLMSPEGIITQWGEGARLLKWWTRDQAEGAHLRLLYPDGGSEDGTAEAHLEEARVEGEYTGEGQRIRADGSTFWGGITLTALRAADGTLLGFAKVTRDLTAARAAEEARIKEAAEARQKAEEANRVKSEFLAVMSHELRTPLSAILGYVDLLQLQSAKTLTDRENEQLRRIRVSGMHMLEIINEVLDFSRLDAGRLSVNLAANQLGRVIESALLLVQPQAQAKEIEISDSVSGFAAGHTYWGDEERVRQILVNVIANAIKFTPADGRVTISAGASVQPPDESKLPGQGPWLYVRVEDTGPGISADRLDAIFEPFGAADLTHVREQGGAGLGLSISRRLARLMGGDLTVRTEVGTGSSFFLWLPANATEDHAVG